MSRAAECFPVNFSCFLVKWGEMESYFQFLSNLPVALNMLMHSLKVGLTKIVKII